MYTILSGLKWKIWLEYLDDVIVFSAMFEEHLNRLLSVLQTILFAGLTLKPEKCHFGFQELQFLGHVVSRETVRPDPDKIEAVAKFPKPDKKEVRRFLGLSAYNQRFIADFAHNASTLTHFTGEDDAFVWDEQQEASFNELRLRLETPPVVAHFYEDAPTAIHTEASNVGLGAVLVQCQDGAERVVAYASRTLTRAESTNSTTEKGCLAVVWAVAKFRPYLYGRAFEDVSDHHSHCSLTNMKDPSGRLA